MQKISVLLGLLILLTVRLAVLAQGTDRLGVITPQNAAQVVQLARLGRGTAHAVAWSPDGKTLAVGGSLGVWLYDMTHLDAQPRLLDGHPTPVPTATFTATFTPSITPTLTATFTPTDTPTPLLSPTPTAPPCPSAPPARLTVGQPGRVLDLDPNPINMRSGAGRASPRILQVPAGAIFQVRSGPVCADGYYWYEVDYNGTVGWIAEGDSTSYFVEPHLPGQ